MKTDHFNNSFFFLLLALVGVLLFFILQPFLTAILAAAILAALFQGRYDALEKGLKKRKRLAASVTVFLIASIIVIPVFAILGLAVNEASTAYERVARGDGSVQGTVALVSDKIESLPFATIMMGGQLIDTDRIAEMIKSFSQNILGFAQLLYLSITSFILWLFATLFALFYFLIDGRKMVAYGMKISPLRDEHERLLITKFVSMSRATLRGTILVSIVQGTLGGMAFAIVGVPSPVIWGLVMTLLSVIPLVGAGIVWLPAGLILLLLGQVWQGVFILAFGMGVISTIDNVLRPKLVGGDTQMHPLMVFFATLGGISFFGFPGFIIGPIIASLALALADIYALEFRAQLKAYNK